MSGDLRNKFKENMSFAGAKGAAVAAEAKRSKRAIIIAWLDYVIKKEGLDITPTLANKIIIAARGRGVSNRFLNEKYGSEGRDASQKSPDFSRIDEIVKKYRHKIPKNA